jgi:hypothetical protein
MCVIYQKHQSFFVVYSPKIYEMATNTRIWTQTDPYERISGLCLQPHKWMHVLALTGMWVITQDFGHKSKLKFWS